MSNPTKETARSTDAAKHTDWKYSETWVDDTKCYFIHRKGTVPGNRETITGYILDEDDAKLIAAAPTQHEACKDALNFINTCCVNTEAVKSIRATLEAAIQLATK